MQKRRLSLLMAIITILTLLPSLATPAQAAYENTYVNTGDQRKDIIGVALTQVGYMEGDGKSNNNKNKYSEALGYGARAWCGDFVSWCARQADIPKSVLKNSGPAKPSTFGITTVYEKGSGYTPQPGDLFFKSNYGHVGIVYYTSGKYFYTIEGNTWTGSPRKDGVYIRKREIADFHFGVPNYTSDSADATCDHSYKTTSESAHPHKEYKICSKCSHKIYTGKELTVSSCTTCAQESCKHDYSVWTKTSSTKHKKVCSICNKSVSANHNWSAAMITLEPTCTKAGKKTQTCVDCKAEKTTTIPSTGEHAVDEIEYINEKYHGQTCADCGKVIKSKHRITKYWTADGKNHWHYCEDCGNRYDITEHTYTQGCASECKVCQYVSPFSHELSDTYSFDEQNHWKICGLCNEAVDSTSHNFTSDCDTKCDTCGAVRVAATAHTLVQKYDESGHWQECTKCNQIETLLPHSPDTTAPDWQDQYCTDCPQITRSKDSHVHTYETIEYDRSTHWGICGCGESIPAEEHQWDENTNTCNICNAKNSLLGAHSEHDWFIYLAIGIIGFSFVMIMPILIIRAIRRKRYE